MIFRQTAGTYLPLDEWKSHNANDPSKPNYSILDQLETFRGSDGTFHFKLEYALSASPDNTNIWRQTSNPIKKKGVTGYEAVDVEMNGFDWGGLEKTRGSQPGALLHGNVGQGSWWYAIGTNDVYKGVGIPGAGRPETLVELYIWEM